MFSNLKVTNVSLNIEIDNNDGALLESPQHELITALEQAIILVRGGIENRGLKDTNGNPIGTFEMWVEGEEWPDENQAIAEFKDWLSEQGHDFDDMEQIDPTELAQEWGSWVDQRISSEYFPKEASGWSYD